MSAPTETTDEKLALALLALSTITAWYTRKQDIPRMPREVHESFRAAQTLLGWKGNR